jgi:hypothetical protein
MAVRVASVEAQVKITKKPDDPAGKARVSVGEQPGGYYCIYRGSKEAAIAGLEAALDAMKKMAAYLDAATGEPGEPETAPEK